MVVVHHLHGRGEQGLCLLPDPACSIRHHAQADLLLRAQAGSSSVCTWCQLSTWTIRSSASR
jgi:hypothetical protein